MDIEKIEHFLVFAEYLNFTAAANKVFMDTSVFHRQISSIEKELNVQLIQRDNRAMSLTPAGESFANGMRNVLELYNLEVQKAADLGSGIRGTVLLCNIVGHKLSDGFAKAVESFEETYPDVKVFIVNKSMSESRSLLKKGYVDFAIARDENYSSIENIRTLPIEPIRAGYAIHQDLLTDQFDESNADAFMDRYPLIWCRSAASNHGMRFIQERENRLGRDSILWVEDLETSYSYVELKRGFTLINDLCFFRNLPEIRYFPSRCFGEPIHSLVRMEDNTNSCAMTFVDFMRKYPVQSFRKA